MRHCFVQAEHKGQLKRRAKAIFVPAENTVRVLPNAFSHLQDLRHVQVEVGIHTIGEAAWQSLLNRTFAGVLWPWGDKNLLATSGHIPLSPAEVVKENP